MDELIVSSSTAPSTTVSSPAEMMRKLDPLRAHGAWIYLCTSIAAGAIVGANYGVEAAMLAGTSFVGAFLATAGIAVSVRRRQRQIVMGLALAIFATLGALAFRARPQYMLVALLAAVVAISAVLLARRFGYLAHLTLLAGVAALAMAAPVSAVAGGASLLRAATLFSLLWPVYSWRTFRVATAYVEGRVSSKSELRSRGLQEAGIAALWSLTVAIGLRFF